MPDHHCQIIVATAGPSRPSLPGHHQPPPSHRHIHAVPPPPSPGLRDHVFMRCSQHPRTQLQAHKRPISHRTGYVWVFPQGQHSTRDEKQPKLTVNPVAKPRVQRQIRFVPKQDTNVPHVGKSEELRMHHRDASSSLSLQVPRVGHSRYSFTRFRRCFFRTA
jgi:hypothetical protein